MFIQFDKKNMHIQVICGILEKFEPTAEISEINDKVVELKKLIEEFQTSTLGPKLQEIDNLINTIHEKRKIEKTEE